MRKLVLSVVAARARPDLPADLPQRAAAARRRRARPGAGDGGGAGTGRRPGGRARSPASRPGWAWTWPRRAAESSASTPWCCAWSGWTCGRLPRHGGPLRAGCRSLIAAGAAAAGEVLVAALGMALQPAQVSWASVRAGAAGGGRLRRRDQPVRAVPGAAGPRRGWPAASAGVGQAPAAPGRAQRLGAAGPAGPGWPRRAWQGLAAPAARPAARCCSAWAAGWPARRSPGAPGGPLRGARPGSGPVPGGRRWLDRQQRRGPGARRAPLSRQARLGLTGLAGTHAASARLRSGVAGSAAGGQAAAHAAAAARCTCGWPRQLAAAGVAPAAGPGCAAAPAAWERSGAVPWATAAARAGRGRLGRRRGRGSFRPVACRAAPARGPAAATSRRPRRGHRTHPGGMARGTAAAECRRRHRPAGACGRCAGPGRRGGCGSTAAAATGCWAVPLASSGWRRPGGTSTAGRRPGVHRPGQLDARPGAGDDAEPAAGSRASRAAVGRPAGQAGHPRFRSRPLAQRTSMQSASGPGSGTAGGRC